MTTGRGWRIILVTILAVLALTGCDQVPGAAPQSPYQPPPPDKIEKPASKVTLSGRVLIAKEGNIWLLTQDTFKQISTGGRNRQPSWSPDGKQVAFIKMGSNSSDVWVMNADGGNAKALTQFQSADLKSCHWAFQPVWSPDGKQIAFVSEATSIDLALWTMNADGSSRRQIAVLANYSGGIDNPTWAPDGTRVAVTAYRDTAPQVWTFSLKSGEWLQVTKSADGAYDASWSPDGKRVAYVARDQGKNDVWIVNVDGSSPAQVTSAGWCRAPAWSPDGAYLGYMCEVGGYFDFWTVKVTATETKVTLGAPEQVTKNAQLDPASGISWSK